MSLHLRDWDLYVRKIRFKYMHTEMQTYVCWEDMVCYV